MCRRACSLVHGTICRGGRDPASVSASTWANLPGQPPPGPSGPPDGPRLPGPAARGCPVRRPAAVRSAGGRGCPVRRAQVRGPGLARRLVSRPGCDDPVGRPVGQPEHPGAGLRRCPGAGLRTGTRRRKEARNRALRACGPRSRRAVAGPRRVACPGRVRAAAPAAAAMLGTSADGWRAGLAAACHELYSEPVTFHRTGGLECPARRPG